METTSSPGNSTLATTPGHEEAGQGAANTTEDAPTDAATTTSSDGDVTSSADPAARGLTNGDAAPTETSVGEITVAMGR